MGNRPKVDKQKFIEDIRAGLTREDLRSKHEMTPTAFDNLLSQLLQQGRITSDDLRDSNDTTSNSGQSQEISRRKEKGGPVQEDSPPIAAEGVMVVDEFLRDPLLRLIELVDQCNHAVKQGDWYQSDLDKFYQMKDAFMEKLYRNPPTGIEVKLKLVPYLRRCPICKDKAGNAMRSEANAKDFEHYLERIPPCGKDTEDAERASLEMDVRYMGRAFCFHIPAQQAQDWKVEMTALERKTWIPAKKFNHVRFAPLFDEIRTLLTGGLLEDRPVEFESAKLKMERLSHASNGKSATMDERLEFYRRVLRDGKAFIAKKDKHYRVEYEGMFFTRATIVYYVAHPDEGLLKEGEEEIHHKDWDRLNDRPENLQRLSTEEHRRIHQDADRLNNGPANPRPARGRREERQRGHSPMAPPSLRQRLLLFITGKSDRH